MDEKRLDQLTRGLADGASRRTLLAGLFGGAAAILVGDQASAVNPRKRRRRRRRRGGKGDNGTAEAIGEVTLPPGTLAGGVWDETIQICHFDHERGEYRVTSVPTVQVPDYLNAGDTLYIDCCVDSDCHGMACFTSSGCIEGACAYDATPGVSCDLGNGAYGVCDEDGVCVGAAAPPPAPAPVAEAPVSDAPVSEAPVGYEAPPVVDEAPLAYEAPAAIVEEAPLAQQAAPVVVSEAPVEYEAPIIATSAVPVG